MHQMEHQFHFMSSPSLVFHFRSSVHSFVLEGRKFLVRVRLKSALVTWSKPWKLSQLNEISKQFNSFFIRKHAFAVLCIHKLLSFVVRAFERNKLQILLTVGADRTKFSEEHDFGRYIYPCRPQPGHCF